MKADLTRDTFHPLKHYARVLTQQGRVQLDADMNEQAAILLRYLHTLAADLIGPAGGPADPQGNVGFAIAPLTVTPAPNPPDFQIGFGDYYVNGSLCQADFVPMAIFPTAAPAVFQLMNWSSEFELQPNPYFYEIFDSTPSSTPPPVPVPVVIASASKAQNQYQLTFQTAPILTGFSTPTLRRFITYLHQPDFVFSTKSNPNSPLPLLPGLSQIYLDVWERAITFAEDDSIREVALGGPDTAARTKLVWQVKWTQPALGTADAPICMTIQQLNAQVQAELQGQTKPPFQPQPRGWLQAMAKQSSQSTNPCIINPNAAYTGPENQLYRVEINRGGAAWDGNDPTNINVATFKWSRENGSAIYPISSGGNSTIVFVESLGRDDRFGLVEGSLVEVQDDRSVLLNLPGSLQSVQGVDPASLKVTLSGKSADTALGSDETLHPLLRRWDQTNGDPNEGGLTLANDNCAFIQESRWLTLEDGVQIQFQPADPVNPANPPVNRYITGDYWLIPARTASGDVEWPKVTDAQGNPETDTNGNIIPVALPPHGITHYYAPLAVISVDANGVSVPTNCRSSFSPGAAPMK
ncbi:MAG: DUF6519 domain-containing protein [Terriglobales bacterium]